MEDPDGEAEVLGVAGALEDAVADPEVLVAHPLEPEVGVTGPEVGGAGQRDVRQAAVRQGSEGGIHPGTTHGANLSGLVDASRPGFTVGS